MDLHVMEIKISLNIEIGDFKIHTVPNPKIFDVYVEGLLTFNEHASEKIHSKKCCPIQFYSVSFSSSSFQLELSFLLTLSSTQSNQFHSVALGSTQFHSNPFMSTVLPFIFTQFNLITSSTMLPMKEHNIMLTKQFMVQRFY